MAGYLPIFASVPGCTVYVNGKLVSRDGGFSMPEITPVTASVNMMGPTDVPIWPLIESMEATISKVGLDYFSASIIDPARNAVEFRWAQLVKEVNGQERMASCRAYLSGSPKSIPGFEVEVGSPIESDYPISVLRYRLVIEGQEVLLVDKTTGKCTINGKDMTYGLNALL